MNKNGTNSYWLYVLNLEQNKYYVGITSKTPEVRMKQHMSGFLGAKWTKQYRPLSILESRNLGLVSYKEAEDYENEVVREYIKKYGHDNVRGGDLSYSGKLIRRFGWYWPEDDWQLFMGVVILMLIIIYLAVSYYLK